MDAAAQAIIQKIDDSYSQAVRLYRSVPVAKVIEPSLSNGWSVKDVIAHIAAWEWRCASLLQESHKSDAPLKAEPHVDALNQEIHQDRQEWAWEEVEYDFRAAHRALIEAIKNFPAERLKSKFVKETIATHTWQHYAKHLPDIQRWHKQVSSSISSSKRS